MCGPVQTERMLHSRCAPARVRYPGTRRYYLEGVGLVNGGRCIIYALPGENYPAQPYRARGFTRFVRDVNGNGYWVKVKRTNNNG